jgi:pilus assembly protein Flp/PilA
MKKFLARFLANESGATAIEYSLIAVGIAVAIVGAVKLVGTNVNTEFGAVADGFK